MVSGESPGGKPPTLVGGTREALFPLEPTIPSPSGQLTILDSSLSFLRGELRCKSSPPPPKLQLPESRDVSGTQLAFF